jgi:hypothetical protein
VLIHELAHLAYAVKGKDQDLALALKLRLNIKKGASGRDASQALGDYFYSGCDPSLLRRGKK